MIYRSINAIYQGFARKQLCWIFASCVTALHDIDIECAALNMPLDVPIKAVRRPYAGRCAHLTLRGRIYLYLLWSLQCMFSHWCGWRYLKDSPFSLLRTDCAIKFASVKLSSVRNKRMGNKICEILFVWAHILADIWLILSGVIKYAKTAWSNVTCEVLAISGIYGNVIVSFLLRYRPQLYAYTK